jgi:hypothetical protein
LRLQQLTALLFHLPLMPIDFALLLRSLKLFLAVELLLAAAILHLLFVLHIALPCIDAGDDGSAQ